MLTRIFCFGTKPLARLMYSAYFSSQESLRQYLLFHRFQVESQLAEIASYSERLVAKAQEIGSSGKCRGGFMNEVKTQFEIGEVSESIGLSFEDFDFVIEAFQGAG